MKRKALGRGLSALLSDMPVEDVERKKVREIAITAIEENHLQPRSIFDDEGLRELSASIQVHGVLQPLLVREHPEDGTRYQLIAGERRLRASRLAGLESLPCIVLQAKEAEMLEIALVENIQRSNLNVVEEARAYKHLSERFSLTQEEVAARVGKSRGECGKHYALLNLPEKVLKMLENGEISTGHAKCLLSMKSNDTIEQSQDILWRII